MNSSNTNSSQKWIFLYTVNSTYVGILISQIIASVKGLLKFAFLNFRLRVTDISWIFSKSKSFLQSQGIRLRQSWLYVLIFHKQVDVIENCLNHCCKLKNYPRKSKHTWHSIATFKLFFCFSLCCLPYVVRRQGTTRIRRPLSGGCRWRKRWNLTRPRSAI